MCTPEVYAEHLRIQRDIERIAAPYIARHNQSFPLITIWRHASGKYEQVEVRPGMMIPMHVKDRIVPNWPQS